MFILYQQISNIIFFQSTISPNKFDTSKLISTSQSEILQLGSLTFHCCLTWLLSMRLGISTDGRAKKAANSIKPETHIPLTILLKVLTLESIGLKTESSLSEIVQNYSVI